MSKLQNPRGTYDALPEQCARLSYIENRAREIFGRFGYGEIRTPVFESADVYLRTVGDTTDIVTKEMYIFEDRSGERMSLRPEGTAGVVRAYYSNGLKQNLPLKLCYVGAPMFRYERPQKGRFRQFHQTGIELFGVASPKADVDVIAAGVQFVQDILKKDVTVKINSLGTAEDRAAYRAALLEYFAPVKDKLSAESRERLEKNPLRILDSKEKEDQPFLADAPRPVDMLSDASQAHFDEVLKGLDALGVNYDIDKGIVRGLDYYTHTVFEIHGEGLGAQSQVIGGGRFDGLFETMGGESVPAVGFGCGMERLEMIMPDMDEDPRPVGFAIMSEDAYFTAAKLADDLRREGVNVYLPLELSGFGKQMKKLNKINASHAIIIGDDELEKGVFQVKDLDAGTQEELTAESVKIHFLEIV